MVAIYTRAIFLIGSNLAFLLPSIVALRDTMYYEAMIYAMMFLISSLYHVVDVFAGAHLGLSYGVWQKLDFYFAFCMVSRTTFMVVFNTGTSCPPEDKSRNLQIKQVVNVLLDTLCLALVLQNVQTPWFVAILAVVCATASIVAMAVYPTQIKLDWCDLIVGWLFIGVGVIFYIACGSCQEYWVFHAIWHSAVALGIFLQIESRNRSWGLLECIWRYTCRPCKKACCETDNKPLHV